jgi:ATP-dependent helicase YprA (DUF1998 family)
MKAERYQQPFGGLAGLPACSNAPLWRGGESRNGAHIGGGGSGEAEFILRHHNGFPGGVGITRKGFDLLPELWSATLDVIQGCACEGGCPSCVQAPKCGKFNQPLDEKVAGLAALAWKS